jgi:hypothetical protein
VNGRSAIAVASLAALSIVAGYPGILVAVAQADVQGICGSGDGTPNHPFVRPVMRQVARSALRHRREVQRTSVRLDPVCEQAGIGVLPLVRVHAVPDRPTASVGCTSTTSTSPRGPPLADS